MRNSNMFSITSFDTCAQLSGIQVDFTAPFNLNKTSNSIVPAFCKDKNYFTPAFILHRQKEYYSNNIGFEKLCFQQKKQKAQKLVLNLELSIDKESEISVFMPSSNYCQICKITFSSYIDHLREENHQLIIQTSQANNYIIQLCQSYKQFQTKGSEKIKKKLIKKQNKTYTFQSQNKLTQSANNKILKNNKNRNKII